jgi:hypothetical protein
MLSLRDPHVRLVLLSHIASRAAAGAAAELNAAGIQEEQVEKLRELKAMDLIHLADMHGFPIGVTFELVRLEAALRGVAMLNRAKSLELYFVRNGASSRMMHTLFKTKHKATRERRREQGAWLPPGRARLPRRALRDRIVRVWLSIKESDARIRYYLLHRSFHDLPIAVLEAVILSEAANE